MTPEAQRIAIAEATHYERQDDKYYRRQYWRDKRHPNSCALIGLDLYGDSVSLPDYLNDLNAMIGAGQDLAKSRGMQLSASFLGKDWHAGFTDLTGAGKSAAASNANLCYALAKAFLKTLNLWTEQP